MLPGNRLDSESLSRVNFNISLLGAVHGILRRRNGTDGGAFRVSLVYITGITLDIVGREQMPSLLVSIVQVDVPKPLLYGILPTCRRLR